MTDTLTAYNLALRAGVASPDSPTSAGAEWLEQVYGAFQDQDWEDAEPYETIDELADDAVPLYTHERWQVFIDLAAYQEDEITDYGTIKDMTVAAGVALFIIARRLLTSLVEEPD